MKTERNNGGNIATMTIHYATTQIGIGYNDNATILMIIMTIITMWSNDEGHRQEKPMSDKMRDERRRRMKYSSG